MDKAQITHRGTYWLIGRVMPYRKIRVVQGLLAGDTLGRIEVEELGKKIDGEGVRAREECCERNTRFDGQRTNVVLGLLTLVSIYTLQIVAVATNTRRPNAAQCVFRRRAKVMEDLVQLIDVAEPKVRARLRGQWRHSLATFEDRLACE